MVKDNNTGLIWEVKENWDGVADYSNPHDTDNTYTWYDSDPQTNGGDAGTPGDGTDTEDFINTLNSSNFGGFSDWRLPTVKELSLIVDSGTGPNPAINTVYFPHTYPSSPASYWSSTTCGLFEPNAWRVEFFNGVVITHHKNYPYYVRAVRGGPSEPSSHFVDNGDGTVTDTFTGLTWKQTTAGTMNWETALVYCEGLILNNDGQWTNDVPNGTGTKYDDWRLPNRNELHSIVDHQKEHPAINTVYFPDIESDYLYYSSTTFLWVGGNTSWGILFSIGAVQGASKSETHYYVLAVRGGGYLCSSGQSTNSTGSPRPLTIRLKPFMPVAIVLLPVLTWTST
jgi:hypothetical protein